MTNPELFAFNTIIVFSSIFGVLGLNSLLLFFVLRHKVFIHFCILVFALAAHISLPLWDEAYTALASKFSIITALSTTLGALYFTQSFIGITRTKYPKWSLVFRILIVISLATAFAQLCNILVVDSDELSSGLSYIAALATLLTLLINFAVCFSLWNREKLASLYLYTNLPMILAAVAYVIIWFSQQGEGEAIMFPYVRLVIFSGMAAQMVLFSVFVGYKIKNIEKEKLILERNINQKLQAEVDLQTSSLKETMEEMEEQRNELQRTNELKNKLFSLVAHDLRNPLQNLSSLIDLLEQNLLDPEKVAEFTHQTKVGLSESLVVMERLLHWSYKQLDGINVQQETIDLEKMVNDVKSELKSLAKNKDITIENGISDCEISFDRDMLRVVLRNLLSNGIKFSYEGGTIQISSASNQDEVQVSIQDQGVGMNPIWYEELVKTGKPAVRPGTKGEKGNGFGLLITKDFIEMNGGILVCESEENKGTKFTFSVPIQLH
ncbi:ATP-binding protein [Ekhidna sp. To15]|uniref:sensor histidine kinase n=1 Tax=Ekhidna sp. To15 TaxID=3395267 RepID=UPI003F521EA5